MHMALEHWMVTILFWRIIPKKEKEGEQKKPNSSCPHC